MQIIRDERNSFMDFEGVFIGNVTRLEDSLDMGKVYYIAKNITVSLWALD